MPSEKNAENTRAAEYSLKCIFTVMTNSRMLIFLTADEFILDFNEYI